MAQKFAFPRETRSHSRSINTKHTNLKLDEDLPKKPPKTRKKAPKTKVMANMAQPLTNNVAHSRLDDSSDGLEEDGNAASGAATELTDSDEDDESEAFAPSDRAIGRSRHQTGLLRAKLGGDSRRSGPRSDSLSDSSDGTFQKSPEPAQDPPVAVREASVGEDTTDADSYAGVDYITDSDGDEPKVERLEENIIIESMERDGTAQDHLFDPLSPSIEEEWPGDDDLDSRLLLSDVPYLFEMHNYLDRYTLQEEVTHFNAGTALLPALKSSPVAPQRRVHFADDITGRNSDGDAVAVDAGHDTELFMPQDCLDPTFAQIIENDDGDYVDQLDDDEVSLCDYNHRRFLEALSSGYTGARTTSETPVQSGHGSDASGGHSSGYETDQGETTDDAPLLPTTVNRPQASLRLHSNSPVARRAAPTPVPASARGQVSKDRLNRRGPRLGSFKTDPKKPIAVIDRSGKHMIIYEARRPSKTGRPSTHKGEIMSSSAQDSSDSFLARFLAKDYGKVTSPMVGTCTDPITPGVLYSALGAEDVNGGDVFGFSIGSEGLLGSDAGGEMDENDDGESQLNVEDFIDFGDDSSDDNAAFAPLVALKEPLSPLSTESKTSTSHSQSFLDHLSRNDVVNAFRQNQKEGTRRANDDPTTHALKGPHLGKFSISPRSPIHKEKTNTLSHRRVFSV